MNNYIVIARLISKNLRAVTDLKAQLRAFESGALRLGIAEIRTVGGNISKPWANTLRRWICERESLLDRQIAFMRGERKTI
jgi:hypothetical protein